METIVNIAELSGRVIRMGNAKPCAKKEFDEKLHKKCAIEAGFLYLGRAGNNQYRIYRCLSCGVEAEKQPDAIFGKTAICRSCKAANIPQKGVVYLYRFTAPGGQSWLKMGTTASNLDKRRRELCREGVTWELLAEVVFPTKHSAESFEKTAHKTLQQFRLDPAGMFILGMVFKTRLTLGTEARNST